MQSKSSSPFLSNISTLSKPVFNNFLSIIDPSVHPSFDPKHAFTGYFAPVDEHDPIECTVIQGQLPLHLNSVYIRNGPNPQLDSPYALHLFDGDGMLHSVRLSDGKATYCSRCVKTHKYMLERDAGSPVIPNAFSGIYGTVDLLHFVSFIGKAMVGRINVMNGYGVANVSVAFVANKLLALCDSDLPYVMNVTQDGEIETLGLWNLDSKLTTGMAAHPNVDPDTNETFAFNFSITYFRFDEDGFQQRDVPILSIKRPTFIHDFAVTTSMPSFTRHSSY